MLEPEKTLPQKEQNSAQHVYLDCIKQLKTALHHAIVGQEKLVERLLIALLTDGHLLVEGAPGLAKTRAIKVLADYIEGDFHRIQFTPDLLPADLTGTDIYRPQSGDFEFQPGPIFHHLILADEINRAPAKVQSALLEAMAERQITIGRQTHQLPKLFLVMATQNPIEQAGTYPLPEAQLDRFSMYVRVSYPAVNDEYQILKLNQQEAACGGQPILQKGLNLSQEMIFAARQDILQVHISEALEQYIVQLILASRQGKNYSQELGDWIRYGASPRGTIALHRAACAYAWLQERDYVTPDDIHEVAYDVLRHRILLTYHAEAEGISSDHILRELLNRVAIP